MKTTLSIIKADIGSIGGHITPSKEIFKGSKSLSMAKARG